MINKKALVLLAILAGGIYFYNKRQTNSLIILCLLALVVYLLVDNSNQHLTSEHMESIGNLASMYENGVLKATNLHVTGTITMDGTELNCTNPQGVTVQTTNGPFNITSAKNIATRSNGSVDFYTSPNSIIGMHTPNGATYISNTLGTGNLIVQGNLDASGTTNLMKKDAKFAIQSSRTGLLSDQGGWTPVHNVPTPLTPAYYEQMNFYAVSQ